MQKFKEFYNENLLESIGIVDGNLVFDYNKLKAEPDELSTRFGKSTKAIKFVPYVTTSDTILKHKIFSVYLAKGTSKTDILKAIKRHKTSNISLDVDSYKKFIQRTAIYINAKFVQKLDIDTIIAPTTSSSLIEDLLEELKKRAPGIKLITKSFEKANIDDIVIAKDHPKITPEIIKYLETQMRKAKENGYFEMKEIKRTQMRKFISNFMQLTNDPSLRNQVDGKNVMLFDDIIVSGITTAEMIRNLEMYSPNSLVAVTIFKTV